MAKATNSTAQVSKINVRMYRAGTGDFFILQFKKGNTVSFKMMIDCGCINGSKENFEPLVNDLKTLTGGTIDLLVVSHEHADHINGFERCKDIFDKFKFKKVWFAWTEDKDDPFANDLRANHSKLGMALNTATEKLNALVKNKHFETQFKNELEGKFMLEGKKHFINSLTALNALNVVKKTKPGKPLPTMEDRLREWNVIKQDTEVEFLEPGDVRGDFAAAKGIKFFVLGPPKDIKLLSKEEKKGENFEKREKKSTTDFAFLSALAEPGLESDASRLPFEFEYESTNAYDPIQQLYNSSEWQKIDNDWLFSAGSLALKFEKSINNTSLALAIQFEDSEKVLLFPADAELGNWESWHNGLKWPVKIKGKTEQKNAEYFLNKTVFYKVGHHLSQNGTAKGRGIEMMTSTEMAAMVTLDFKKIQPGWLNTMPNDFLGAELIRKSKGNVFFVGDRKKILPNIKTKRVNIKKTDEIALNNANKKFDNKFFIDYEVSR